MNKENSGIWYTALVCMTLIVLILGIFFHVAFGKNEPEKQKEISVILYAAGSEGWESMQEGMKRAEDDFSVNINYVILRDEANAEEQIAAIEREIENGAEGIILAVTDYMELYKRWIVKSFTVPVVTVESGFDESTISFVSADNYEMGKRLGEEILKDFPDEEGLVVALDMETVKRDSVEKREQGLKDALRGRARLIPLRVAANGESADAVAALHKEAALELAGRTEPAINAARKYGIGNTASIVAALDQGKMDKLIFQNEFNMGYLAVETLLGEMGMIRSKERENIDYYCVSREAIYDTPYEQLLFPIVE